MCFIQRESSSCNVCFFFKENENARRCVLALYSLFNSLTYRDESCVFCKSSRRRQLHGRTMRMRELTHIHRETAPHRRVIKSRLSKYKQQYKCGQCVIPLTHTDKSQTQLSNVSSSEDFLHFMFVLLSLFLSVCLRLSLVLCAVDTPIANCFQQW